jgi:hypothetical protein
MKKTVNTRATLLLCGVVCNPPILCILGKSPSASESCVGDGNCSLSNLIRFTALRDVSIYESVNKIRAAQQRSITSSWIDSTSLSNFGISISL